MAPRGDEAGVEERLEDGDPALLGDVERRCRGVGVVEDHVGPSGRLPELPELRADQAPLISQEVAHHARFAVAAGQDAHQLLGAVRLHLVELQPVLLGEGPERSPGREEDPVAAADQLRAQGDEGLDVPPSAPGEGGEPQARFPAEAAKVR